MEIHASGSAPRLAGAQRFHASTGDLRSVLGRMFGSFFVGCNDQRVVIAMGAANGRQRLAPFIVLERGEIAMVDSTAELWAIPGPDGGLQRAEFRLLDLHLVQAHDAALEQAVQQGPRLVTGIHPVSLPQPGVLRLVWDGPGIHVRPGIGRALDLLGRSAPRAPRRETDWRELSDVEFGEHVLRLYEAGRYGEAVELVRRRDAGPEASA